MRFSQGSVANPAPSALFRNYLGVLTDPDSVTVDLYDAQDNLVADDEAPTRVAEGSFNFPITFEDDAPIGLWRIVWKAVIDGITADPADEYFEVVASGDIIVTSDFTPYAALAWTDRPAISFQLHPEFEPDYAKALIKKRYDVLPNPNAAIASLDQPDDRARVAEWIRRFLTSDKTGERS